MKTFCQALFLMLIIAQCYETVPTRAGMYKPSGNGGKKGKAVYKSDDGEVSMEEDWFRRMDSSSDDRGYIGNEANSGNERDTSSYRSIGDESGVGEYATIDNGGSMTIRIGPINEASFHFSGTNILKSKSNDNGNGNRNGEYDKRRENGKY